jgi:hypothetical protein
MPDSAAHRKRAEDNEEFAKYHLRGDDATDQPWIITAYFYAAVHWVEAYLALAGYHSRTHFERKRHISTDPKLIPIQPWYRELEDRSKDARYELVPFAKPQIDSVKQNYLDPLRTYIVALLP